MDKDILYLSKAITTDKVVFRLLLKQTKKRKQAIAIVTNLDYTKQIKDSIKRERGRRTRKKGYRI